MIWIVTLIVGLVVGFLSVLSSVNERSPMTYWLDLFWSVLGAFVLEFVIIVLGIRFLSGTVGPYIEAVVWAGIGSIIAVTIARSYSYGRETYVEPSNVDAIAHEYRPKRRNRTKKININEEEVHQKRDDDDNF